MMAGGKGYKMTKTSFYSVMFKDNKKQAILHSGYSDGTYYYYRADSATWYAIHPLLGLSVASANTRKEASVQAHSEKIREALQNIYANTAHYEKLGADFDKLRAEAER